MLKWDKLCLMAILWPNSGKVMLVIVKEEEVLIIRIKMASKDKTVMVSMKIWVINTWLTEMEPVHSVQIVVVEEPELELQIVDQITKPTYLILWTKERLQIPTLISNNKWWWPPNFSTLIRTKAWMEWTWQGRPTGELKTIHQFLKQSLKLN